MILLIILTILTQISRKTQKFFHRVIGVICVKQNNQRDREIQDFA